MHRRNDVLLRERDRPDCGIEDVYVIIRAIVARALAGLHADSFDIMIFDPTYDERADDLLAAAAEHLSAGGVLVLEHARRVSTPEQAGRLRKSREVISGDSALGFYANS